MKPDDTYTKLAEQYCEATTSLKKKPRISELKRFAEAFAKIEHEISTMPLRKLKSLLVRTPRYTQTNCWWAEYAVAPIVFTLAEKEINRRKNLKKTRKA